MVLLVFGIVFSEVSEVVGAFDLGWLGYPLTVICVVAMTNIFNFMDGLNGLAGGVAVTVAAFSVQSPISRARFSFTYFAM